MKGLWDRGLGSLLTMKTTFYIKTTLFNLKVSVMLISFKLNVKFMVNFSFIILYLFTSFNELRLSVIKTICEVGCSMSVYYLWLQKTRMVNSFYKRFYSVNHVIIKIILLSNINCNFITSIHTDNELLFIIKCTLWHSSA